MIPGFTKVHRRFKLDGHHYKFRELIEVAYSFVKEGEPYQRALGEFLLDWLDNKDYVVVKTSGSTGEPKLLEIKKQAMMNSAIITGDFFGLEPKNKILNCLPSNFIAGKMMIIRALALGLELELVEPSAQPLIDYAKPYDFCAFTPMQLKYFLKFTDNIKTIIVGGAPVSKSLLKDIQSVKSDVYETFGMTETVSHIALKKLNNFEGEQSLDELYFKTLPGVSISQDDRGCLVVDFPDVTEETIVTNDIVKLHSETEFEWLGRVDNVINSGGVKLFPEQVERKLQDKIKKNFFVTSLPDETLGQKLVLVVESDSNDLDNSVFSDLDKLEKPKSVFAVKKFARTKSGKVHRKDTLNMVN